MEDLEDEPGFAPPHETTTMSDDGHHHRDSVASAEGQEPGWFGATPVVGTGRHRAVEDDDLDGRRPQQPSAFGDAQVHGTSDAMIQEESEQEDIPTFDVVSPVGGAVLQPYVVFDEPLPPITETPLIAVVAHVVRIVAAEGPVLGHRLHQAYRDAYGGQRVGKEIARLLNRAISFAERRRQIVSDNPRNESGIKPRTFRLPTQPQVVPRELGPRTLDMVPPAELALHLAELSGGDEALSEEELFRAVPRLGAGVAGQLGSRDANSGRGRRR